MKRCKDCRYNYWWRKCFAMGTLQCYSYKVPCGFYKRKRWKFWRTK